jgi:hypothetical protein
MINRGVLPETIAQLTELPLGTIEELREELKKRVVAIIWGKSQIIALVCF